MYLYDRDMNATPDHKYANMSGTKFEYFQKNLLFRGTKCRIEVHVVT